MLSEIFSTVLPESSKYKIKSLGKDYGIIFDADVKSDARILWTLPDLIQSERTYITASTFFGRKRQRRFVRYVLAIVCDFDTSAGTTEEDILDNYRKAGLPAPELIIATATAGHYQAWNIFDEPVRLRHDLILAKITRIHETMVEALGADPFAVGVERWVRRPGKDNIVYHDEYSSTSWTDLVAWYDKRRKPKVKPISVSKVTWIGNLLSTPAGQRIQLPAAERGSRNEWAYGLGLCLYDAGISNEEIRAKLFEWNKAIEEPLNHSEIEKIYRSVTTNKHHASARVLEAITGLSARIKGWYKWARPRERRRDHLTEVREDIIADLEVHGTVTGTQKAWANRLGVAYRTLQLVLTSLRHEGIVEATIRRGRYAQSSYNLSEAYKEATIRAIDLAAAAGAESMNDPNFNRITKAHTAYSPLMGSFASPRDGPAL
jgi:DNA-binding transcriptional regulator YhcF (GntR family)